MMATKRTSTVALSTDWGEVLDRLLAAKLDMHQFAKRCGDKRKASIARSLAAVVELAGAVDGASEITLERCEGLEGAIFTELQKVGTVKHSRAMTRLGRARKQGSSRTATMAELLQTLAWIGTLSLSKQQLAEKVARTIAISFAEVWPEFVGSNNKEIGASAETVRRALPINYTDKGFRVAVVAAAQALRVPSARLVLDFERRRAENQL